MKNIRLKQVYEPKHKIGFIKHLFKQVKCSIYAKTESQSLILVQHNTGINDLVLVTLLFFIALDFSCVCHNSHNNMNTIVSLHFVSFTNISSLNNVVQKQCEKLK